jgi:transcriptional regulator with XRE-family HTH domain/Zn-dependent peptidase ImmA (M78 family)
MTEERWQQSGYSDITRAEIIDGRLLVRFANGDVVEVPEVVTGTLEGATPSFDPDEALAIVIQDAQGRERYLSWTQIRSATDRAFGQHLRDLDAEESRRLARRLKALREDRGMRQAEVAALVSMTPPQLSKIEAGTHDMRLSTVRSLLRALNATFADVSGDVPEVSIRKLSQNVVSSGVPRPVAERLLARVPRKAVHDVLERAFGWTREAVQRGDLQPLPLSTAVQFKAPSQPHPEDAPLVHLAAAVARIGQAASDVGEYEAVPEDPAHIRGDVQARYGDVTLTSLLAWMWARGIPVLPMLGKGVFSAAVWAVDDTPVVVLKEARDLAVFWLFDLAHELGHIARGHIAAGSLIDVASPTSSTALESDDRQEQEANEFALQLLVPDYRDLLAEVRQRSRGHYLAFKGAVDETARQHGVNAGVLGMIAAYELGEIGEHKDRWGSATNLAKIDGPGREPTIAAARGQVRLEKLDDLDRAVLEELVLSE